MTAAPAQTPADRGYIKVHVTLDPEEHSVAGEYLWTTPADDGDPTHFKIENIPFYAYMLALGDVVEVGPAEASPDCVHGGALSCDHCRAPEVVRGVTESGQETGRMYFETHLSRPERLDIATKMTERGAKVEWANEHLLAFSFHMDDKVGPIVDEWVKEKKIAVCDIRDADETE